MGRIESSADVTKASFNCNWGDGSREDNVGFTFSFETGVAVSFEVDVRSASEVLIGKSPVLSSCEVSGS